MGLKILLINPAENLRTEIKILSAYLNRNGHKAIVLTPECGRNNIDNNTGIEYIYYQARFLPELRYTLPTLSFYKKLKYIINDFDVVHIGSYIYPVCLLGAIIGKRNDLPVVVTVDVLPGVNWDYGNRYVNLTGALYTKTLGKKTFRVADRVVALGPYLVDDLVDYCNKEKISIIPNGIDVNKYRYLKNSNRCGASNSCKKDLDILYVGRLDPVKGIPFLLRAFSILLQKSKEYNLVIVGDGSKRREYEQTCKKLGIDQNVEFTGWEDNVEKYYKCCDIFILPSLAEGQPTVLMEAQAAGLPTVATDVGANKEIIKSGCIVPPKDSKAIVSSVEKLKNNCQIGYSQKASEHIQNNFSMNSTSEKYIQLYTELLNES